MSSDQPPPNRNVDGVQASSFVELAYNQPAETVLLILQRRIARGHIVTALYARRRTETQYRQIAGDDYTSASHVVTPEALPIAYFLESTHGHGDPSGSNARAVVRVDLETLTLTDAFSEITGEWPGAFVSRLESVSSDGNSIVGTVGRPRPLPGSNGHGGGYSVDDWLCRIDVATATFEPLTHLRNTLF